MKIYILRKRPIVLALGVILGLLILYNIFSHIFIKKVPVLNPIYIGNTGEKALALMVNVDWGEDILPDMLNVFQNKNVKATFFVTGKFAKKFPQLVKDIVEQGHELGNHGYSHPHPDKISVEENKNEITITEKIFQELNVGYSKIFAPPYGEHKSHVIKAAESLQYKTVLWTVDTIDWKEPAPETIQQKIISKADNGILILMHPKKCTLQALPKIIDELQKKEYVFKTVTEIIQ